MSDPLQPQPLAPTMSQSVFVANTQPLLQSGSTKFQQPPADAINMELRRKLWDGLLPVKVDLALSDLNSIEAPRSLYVQYEYVINIDHGT